MASDHERRKHRRSSDDESKDSLKRHKHRHHKRKHEEATDMPPPSAKYDDMEEGEIVEEDGVDVMEKKITDVDDESRGIKTETHGGMVESNHSLRLALEANLTQKGHRNRKSHDEDDYETKDRKKPQSNKYHMKAHNDTSNKPMHERKREDIATTSRPRSHDHSRAHSRSQSIYHGEFRLKTHKEDIEYYTSKKTNGNGDDEREHKLAKEHRHVSRDSSRDKKSSRNRRSYNYNDRRSDRSSDYRRYRHEETHYVDKPRKHDGKKDDSFKAADVDIKKMKMDEVDEEVYQERSALQVEEDEEDLNRIKEESRRRRQAILETYRTKTLQQQPQLKDDKVKENVEEPPQSVDVKVNSATLDGQGEGSDTNTGDTPFSIGRSPQNGNLGVQRTSGTGVLGEGTPKSERSHEDDIFGESPPRARETKERSNDMFSNDIPSGVRKYGKGDSLTIQRSGLQDNWDDAEGYYSYRFGEILDGRYEVIAAHGKGVFSTVVRAKDLKAGSNDPEEVAIKIIRSNDKMYKAGLEELVILKKLVGADVEDRRHCVNDTKNVLKLCDFGNAMLAGKNEITPYLVSRFYRDPEIILWLTYDHPVDMWSVGCCLFELYTRKVLFPGATNNDMLRLHMELKGPFPKKMLRKGAFTELHFNQDLNFVAIEEDPVTKKTVRRLVNMKVKDIGSILMSSPANFKDLLERMFLLDPDKRIPVQQALSHSFITGK